MLSFTDKGNTTVYEWRYGEAPLTVEEPPLLIDVDTEPTADDDVVSASFQKIEIESSKEKKQSLCR